MSWSIYATGTPDKVREAVEKQVAQIAGYNSPAQLAQAEAAKAVILAELAAPGFPIGHLNGVKVEASGHATGSPSPGSTRDIRINVERVSLCV